MSVLCKTKQGITKLYVIKTSQFSVNADSSCDKGYRLNLSYASLDSIGLVTSDLLLSELTSTSLVST